MGIASGARIRIAPAHVTGKKTDRSKVKKKKEKSEDGEPAKQKTFASGGGGSVGQSIHFYYLKRTNHET
jgi:hypothetical protein